jgi:hypothetical protein
MATKQQSIPGWNQKTAINDFVNSFEIPFDVREDQIDLREMSKNYPSGVIPLHDIHAGIASVLPPGFTIDTPPPYDPTTDLTSPRFAYVDWRELYLWPVFQRDVACNHIEKIFNKFDPTCILVACAVKLTLRDHESYGPDGKTVYCLWDGHHTSQVCKLKNYTKFPIWYIDIDHTPDSVLLAKGFGTTDEERIRYGIFLAGSNMRMINLTIKRPLDAYDDFLIGVETYDHDYVATMNILKNNGCTVKKRASSEPGSFTQVKAGLHCYGLPTRADIKGIFFDRALQFHRKHWPGAPIELEVFRPMAHLYHTADIQGIPLPLSFDDDLGKLLCDNIGDVASIQQLLKISYYECSKTGRISYGSSKVPKSDFVIVMNAIQNYYKQNAGPGQCIIPSPAVQWTVDIAHAMEIRAAETNKKKPASKSNVNLKVNINDIFEEDIDDDTEE